MAIDAVAFLAEDAIVSVHVSPKKFIPCRRMTDRPLGAPAGATSMYAMRTSWPSSVKAM